MSKRRGHGPRLLFVEAITRIGGIIRMASDQKGRSRRACNADTSPAPINGGVVAQLVQVTHQKNGGAGFLGDFLENVQTAA